MRPCLTIAQHAIVSNYYYYNSHSIIITIIILNVTFLLDPIWFRDYTIAINMITISHEGP